MKQQTLVKWTGCKNSMWNELKLLFEKLNPTRFIDVFAGSVSVSLNYNHKNTICNDINPILIELYKQLSSEDFLKWVKEYNKKEYNDKQKYEELRKLYNKLKKEKINGQVCALFLYLNKRGFNGIYRENLSGEYNVPYRKYTGDIYDDNYLKQFQVQIKPFKFWNQDYKKALEECKVGDLVYLDPPYYECENNTFTSYFGCKFDNKEQEKLCECLIELDKKGIQWVLSNANCEPIRNMYSSFYQKQIEVKRKMRHSKVQKEKEKLNEILIWNF